MTAAANPLYPVFLKLDAVPVLLVGGGHVALEKLTFLLKSSPNARVHLVAPQILPELEALALGHAVQLHRRPYAQADLALGRLLLVATDQPVLNAVIAAQGKAHGLLVNVADTPALCDFYLGGIVTRGPLKVGISTHGLSPTLAKRFREFLEACLPQEIDDLAQNLHQLRHHVAPDFAGRVQALNAITASLLQEVEGTKIPQDGAKT